jgi:ABC-type transport system substrate-binding protein
MLIITFLLPFTSIVNNYIQVQTSPKASYLFSVSLLVPTNDPVRMQAAQLIEAEFSNIGIGVALNFVNWATYSSRLDSFSYDLCLYSVTFSAINPGSSLLNTYQTLPPNGNNLMYWADNPQYMSYQAAESKQLIDAFNQESNQTKKEEMLIKWQKIWYDAMPNVLLYYEADLTTWQAMAFNPRFTCNTTLSANDRPLNRKGVRHAISHIIPRTDIVTYLMTGSGGVPYTPIPSSSWAVIPASEMRNYKTNVIANDGSTPEKNAFSASDKYDLNVAKQWLASEGYDTTPWGGPSPGVDTTPPDIAIISPTNSTDPTGTISVDFSGDAWYYWYFISEVDTENHSWVSTVTRPLLDGTYTLHVYGNDSAGNEAYVNVTFTTNDITPPTIKIISPTHMNYTISNITINLSGDAVSYWYFIEGVDDDNQTWIEPVVRTLVDGTYTLHVYGEDSVGNEVYVSVTFSIDTTSTTTTKTSTPGWSLLLLLLSFILLGLLKIRK